MVFIMSGFVILRPEKNPTPRAMIAMMAANLPNVFFISRNVVRLIIDFIGHLPFQMLSFITTFSTVPLLTVMTLSAMAVSAWLCVMTITVVPVFLHVS